MNAATDHSVTVVIVTHNSHHCVTSFSNALQFFSNVIVVDNASDDGTVAAVAAALPHAEIIQNSKNLGFGTANNRALLRVKTPYALLLNPDCIATLLAINQLITIASAYPDAAIIAPQIVRADGNFETSYRWPKRIWRSFGPKADGACCVGFVSGAAMLLNMSLMRDIGFFDERFFLYYEDEDLCHRAFLCKHQIILAPESCIIHLSRGSVRGKHLLKSEFFRGYHHAQSKVIFEYKHGTVGSARALRFRTFCLAFLTLIPRLLFPHPKHLARLCGRIIGLSQIKPHGLERRSVA